MHLPLNKPVIVEKIEKKFTDSERQLIASLSIQEQSKREISDGKSAKEKELPLINMESNSLGTSLEVAFSRALGVYKGKNETAPVSLDSFQEVIKQKYSSQKQEIMSRSEEWFDSLAIKSKDSRLNEFQLSDLEKRYQNKIEMLEILKKILVDRESNLGKSQSLQHLSVSPEAPILSASSIHNSIAILNADLCEEAPIPLGQINTVDKHFRPRKNKVLLKVDVPGVLEADEQAMSSADYSIEKQSLPFLPPIQPSKSIVAGPQSISVKTRRFTKSVENSFVAEPRVVVFDSFIPYQKVSRKLTIKNKSRFSHRLRVSFNPPGSYPTRFSLNIEKTPTELDGSIAPGLSCVYNIEFTPNSFASTSEELLILAENGESVLVPILASREKPILQIPPVLNIGFCMEGRESIFKLPIKNEGGEARFSAMLPNVPLGAFEIFEQIGLLKEMESKPVTISSFTISPSFMYLDKGDSVEIELCYAPQSINRKKGKKAAIYQRQDSQKFKYACDNCDIIEFQVVATVQEAKVDILQCFNPKDSITMIPENTDTTESLDGLFLIDFGSENYGVPKSFTLTVSNPTNLSIPFDWKWVYSFKKEVSHDVVLVSESSKIFKISPSSGILDPLSVMTFTVTFHCFDAKKFGSFLEMVVPITQKRTRKTPDVPKCIARIQLKGEGAPFDPQLNTPFIQIPFGLKLNSKYRQNIGFTNNSLSNMEYSWDIVGVDPKHCKVIIPNQSGIAEPKSCIQHTFEFIGAFPGRINGFLRCKTANGLGPTLLLPIKGAFSIIPGQISFPQHDYIDLGLLKLGSSSVLSVPLRNGSKNPLHFFISLFHKHLPESDCFIKVTPSEGLLEPGKTQVLTITYIPLWYNQLRATLEVFALSTSESTSEPLKSLVAAIDVKATAETPHVLIENPTNFVTCFVGVPFIWTVMIRNSRLLPVSYRFKEQNLNGCNVKFYPSKGLVPAMGVLDVKVQIQCSIVGPKSLDLVGQVLEMVENSGGLKLKLNLDVYEPSFSFSIKENEDAWEQFDESHFKLACQTDAALRLDFGVCPIFAGRTRTLKIRNHSPYPSPFNAIIEKYTPTLDNVDDINDAGEVISKRKVNTLSARYETTSITPRLLQTTADPRFGFSSKGGQEFVDGLNKYRSVLEAMKSILSDGRGAAFHVVPSSGIIPPWGEVTIRVGSYNNLVGLYKDWLLCSVGKISRRLPVQLAVVGSPVKFSGPQLVSSKKDLQSKTTPVDIVNFGTRMISTTYGPIHGVRLMSLATTGKSKSTLSEQSESRNERGSARQNTEVFRAPTKSILVENHSPREIKMEWVVYIKHTEGSRSSEEEFDLNSYLCNENRIGANEAGIIGIQPAVMTIAPFKSSILHCYFRNGLLGSFDAVVLADIAYVDGNKHATFGPRRISKNGEIQSQEPVISPSMTRIEVKDHEAIAKLRIQAKCIEPKLSLDVGSRIRIKKALNKIAELTADYSNLSCIQFLVNQSDAVCSFTLAAQPENLFAVKPSKACLRDAASGTYELKQKQQMMITVYYIGRTDFDDGVKSKRKVSFNPEDERGRSNSLIDRGLDMNGLDAVKPLDVIGEDEVFQDIPESIPNDHTGVQLESGTLIIKYSNGMQQEIPLILEGVYE